jgi:hypothetical protein
MPRRFPLKHRMLAVIVPSTLALLAVALVISTRLTQSAILSNIRPFQTVLNDVAADAVAGAVALGDPAQIEAGIKE